MAYLYLSAAILAEVIGTSALKATMGLTKLWPSVVVFAGYITSFYLLTLVLRSIPLGITYALWSGFGIVLVTLAGAVLYKQIPDTPALIGVTLIIIGAIVIYLFSKTVPH